MRQPYQEKTRGVLAELYHETSPKQRHPQPMSSEAGPSNPRVRSDVARSNSKVLASSGSALDAEQGKVVGGRRTNAMPQLRRRLAPDVKIEDLCDSDADVEEDDVKMDAAISGPVVDRDKGKEEENWAAAAMVSDHEYVTAESDDEDYKSVSSDDLGTAMSSSHRDKGKGKEPLTIPSRTTTALRGIREFFGGKPQKAQKTMVNVVDKPKEDIVAPNTVSKADEIVGPTTDLMALPDELLISVAACLGRTPSHPRASPWPFFKTCRRLYSLSSDTLMKIEFLIKTYGTFGALEHCWSWLKLITPEVMTVLLNRAGDNVKIPRYILQRLSRRCTNAGRLELVPLIAEHAAQFYPPPGGDVPPAIGGFDPAGSDENIFQRLIDAGSVPSEYNYLVDEANRGGWSVANDPVMSALRTLKESFCFDFNCTAPGHVVPENRWNAPRQTTITADVGIEGLNFGFSLLHSAIQSRNIRVVGRLLRLGVSLEYSHSPSAAFFAKCVERARVRAGRNNHHDESRSYWPDTHAGRIVWEWMFRDDDTDDDGLSLNSYWPGDASVLSYQCQRFGRWNDELISRRFIPDALSSALVVALSSRNGDAGVHSAMFSQLLAQASEVGLLGTPSGMESMKKCKRKALDAGLVDVVNQVQAYWRATDGTGPDFELAAALCEGDHVAAQAALDDGSRLTADEMVPFFENDHEQLLKANEFLRKHYPFTKETLSDTLTKLMERACYGDRLKRSMKTVSDFLKAHKKLIDAVSARTLALKWFASAGEDQKRLLFPLLAPIRKDDGQSLQHFALKYYIQRGKADEVKKCLVDFGIRVSAHDMIWTYFGNRKSTLEVFKAFFKRHNYTPADVRDIILAKMKPREDIGIWLLENTTPAPIIDSAMLRSTMTGAPAVQNKAFPLFAKNVGSCQRPGIHAGQTWRAQDDGQEPRCKMVASVGRLCGEL